MHIYDIVIAVVLVVWVLFSIIAQTNLTNIRKFDFLGLLPSFRFFSPRPVSRDIVVYAHAFDNEGHPTLWKELFHAKKKWYCFIWNPTHKLRKSIIDLYHDLDDFREAETVWHLTFPYLILLHASNSLFQPEKNYTKVQFMITCFAGHEESVHDIIFLSNIHAIARNS